MIKSKLFPILALAAVTPPLVAIEPPSDAVPIPPKKAPISPEGEVRRARPAVSAPEEAVMPPAQAPEEGRPFLGVVLEDVPEFLAEHLKLQPGQGVIINQLVDGGPAAVAGMQKNDVILSVEGRPVGVRLDVIGITSQHQVGDELKVEAIQGGERKEFTVVLGARPAPRDVQGAYPPGMDMAQRDIDGLPDRHGDMLRDALQRNLEMLEGLDDGFPDLGNDITGGMIERLRKEMSMGNMQELQGSGKVNSTVRLMDDHGQVELTNDGSGKKARVFDREGTLLWEGPYETAEEMEAAPQDVRNRLDRLDFGSSIESSGNGFRFRFKGGRFRSADEVDPLAPPAGLEEPVPADD